MQVREKSIMIFIQYIHPYFVSFTAKHLKLFIVDVNPNQIIY
jgi:hypothetical protein